MDAIHRAKEIRAEFGISGRVKGEALAERLGLKVGPGALEVRE